ncbi:hypothetical protein [Roseimicrobium sp. ORNL1]|uniref:hypothetical protein n=1 Tax=Roseimicrobium sp. ORNL1 TaxID=2711231 RepID=UPI0013E11D1A|nr:hypothetical protein [Roseimicrobium sp. ORNL1]QIF01969.1 hypothetical protein G5S37_10650 [Roseimicrobium sp. ORNL1]
MFPRIRHLLLVLFLGLLFIPLAYVALTWSPPNPLRFRVAGYGYEAPSREGQFRVSGKLNMIVENTSSAPVKLFFAVLTEPGNPARGIVDPFGPHWTVAMPHHPTSMIIPPHTSLPCFSIVPEDDYPASALEKIELSYHWISTTRAKVSEVREWLFFHAPAFVRPHITMDWPSSNVDTTPLQPALPGQSQPQSRGG